MTVTSPPPYAWRVTGTLKRPSALFFYRFDSLGVPRRAIGNLVWKTVCLLFSLVLVEGLLLTVNTMPVYVCITCCLTCAIIGIPAGWELFAEEWAYAQQTYEEEMATYQQNMLLLQQKHPIPIIGHEQFKRSVERVLDELQDRAADRYKEVLAYFPKAEYKRDLTSATDGNQKVAGRSDGYFSVDGSGRHGQELNTYEWFRFVLLHEVGHNVEWKDQESAAQQERTADWYANRVLVEMGFRPYRR